MADAQKLSDHCATGNVTGTGATIQLVCGFKPKHVVLQNVTGEALLFWNDLMPDAYGYKLNGLAAGTNATSAVTGTGTFLGTVLGAQDITSPAFTGTGQSSSGQVITTTDNQTMTLNQCAGMWFVSATHGPYMISTNTAVSGAPAVLTTYGTAPTTDAGTYKILKNIVPTGSVTALSGTAAAQTFTGAAAETAYITSLGITPLFNGFKIGADTDVNVIAEVIHWTAWK